MLNTKKIEQLRALLSQNRSASIKIKMRLVTSVVTSHPLIRVLLAGLQPTFDRASEEQIRATVETLRDVLNEVLAEDELPPPAEPITAALVRPALP